MDVRWIEMSKQRVGRCPSNTAIRVSSHKSGNSMDHPTRTVITLYPFFMEKARLIVGDRVMVGEDQSGNIVIKRTLENGWKISTNGSSKKTGVVSLNTLINAEKKNYQFSEVTISSDGLISIKKETI